jgi:hypothetical protein
MNNKNQKKAYSAQGTIEYLVIIAVVVVIGLVASVLIFNVNNPEQVIPNNNQITSNIGKGGISVVDSAIDIEGDGLITLRNTSGAPLTLTKITDGTADNIYNERIYSGSEATFSFSDLNTSCVCEEGQTEKTCSFTLTTISDNDITRNETITTTIYCVTDAQTANDTGQTVTSIDVTDPVVSLSSPTDANIIFDGNIEFTYTASDDRNLTSCSLLINGAVDQTDIYPIDLNFSKTFSSGDYNWAIRCHDTTGNTTTTNNRELTIVNPNAINSCEFLQLINQNLDWNYTLSEDIDCSDTINWNDGAGFEPIGNSSNKFTGNFNGNNYTISNLYINRPNTYYIGLFGYTENSNISNIKLDDTNITGIDSVSGLVGYLEQSTIINSSTKGTINGEDKLGALAGSSIDSNINNSFSNANIIGRNTIGGITGYASRTILNNTYSLSRIIGTQSVGGLIANGIYATIKNSYSAGTINTSPQDGYPDIYVGGLIGSSQNGTISNSFTTTNQTNTNYNGGLIGFKYISPITNCYWDTFLTNKSNCSVDSNSGCIPTNNEINHYYSSSNAPLNEWTWGEDGNWTARDNNYPILTWQTE